MNMTIFMTRCHHPALLSDPSKLNHRGAAQGDRSVRGVHVLVWRGVGRHGGT